MARYNTRNRSDLFKSGAVSHDDLDFNLVDEVKLVKSYATLSDLPISDVSIGQFGLIQENGALYFYTGDGWFQVTLINQSPTFTGADATYELALDGTPTVITLDGSDPEGVPLTWSYSITSGSLGNTAVIEQNENVFTITPSTDSADNGTFSITFTASDGVNLATGLSEFTLDIVIAMSAETALSIGTSSTNGLDNSTFVDRSTNAHTVTTIGSPSPVQTAFHPYLDNWSINFQTERLEFGNLSQYHLVTNDWTVESWVYYTEACDGAIVCKSEHSTNKSYVIFAGTDGSVGSLNYEFYGTSTHSGSFGSNLDLPLNTWHHIAYVRDGETISGYLNGTRVGSIDVGVGYAFNTITQPLTVAQNGASGYEFSMKGYLSNTRLVNGTAVYTGDSFTPPTEKLTNITNTSLLLNSNNFKDQSSYGVTPTVVGTPKVSAFNPFGQDSEYLAGGNKGSYYRDNDSYLSVADPNNDFYLNNEQFTMEFWYYRTNEANGSLVSKWASGYSGYRILASATGELGFYNVTTPYYCNSLAPLNAWTHYACTRDASGNMRQFINGVWQRTDNVNPNNAVNTTSLLIGTLHVYPNEGLNQGYISDFSLVKGTAKYTTDFTPPTEPVGNTNAEVYLPMDNAGIFDKAGNNTLTLNGNVATSTTQTKFSDTAMYFDGSGDYITAPQSSSTDLGTGDFTIELWAKTDTSQTLIDFFTIGNYNSTTGALFYVQSLNGGNMKIWSSVGYSNNIFIGDIVTGWTSTDWHHYAFCRSSGVVKTFVDGIETDSFTYDKDLSGQLHFGAAYNASNGVSRVYPAGYIEDFRITKGLARYTADFTPPTASLEG